MVTVFAVLTRLEILHISFESPQSRPDRTRRRPPPPTRTLLPSLTRFEFKGVSEYLDDIVARVDAPLLRYLRITFFHQLIFDTPHLTQFISRTPKLKAYDEAQVEFSNQYVGVRTTDGEQRWVLVLEISCRKSEWQLSSVAQVCSSVFVSVVEHFSICERGHLPPWQDDIESNQWLELLHSLTAVKELRISQKFTPLIAPTLQEVGSRVTEVLPALQTLFLEKAFPSGPVQENIGKFVAARQLAGHPVAISLWERTGPR